MKKLCSILTILTVLSVFGLAINAHAVPIMLPVEPVFFQFNNLEQVDQSLTNSIAVPGTPTSIVPTGYGTAGNWGVFNLSSIQHGFVSIPHTDINGGPVWWSDDGPGLTQGQISGIFYGIDLHSGTEAHGGIMDFYWNDAGSDTITASDMSGTTAPPITATVDRFASGTFLARLNFMPGIVTGNPVTTIKSNSNLTISLSGYADGFAEVDTTVVGLWTSALDCDWFYVDSDGDGSFGTGLNEKLDVRFSTMFNGLPVWDGTGDIKGLRSNDPARTYPIPEPGSMLLLGSGLLVLGGIARRKFKFNKR